MKKGIGNLPKDSKAKADQIQTLDKQRLIKYIGSVPYKEMDHMNKAMLIHLEGLFRDEVFQ